MIYFFIGIISFILGLYYRKKKGDFGNRVVVDGEITKVCETEHCVYVKYVYDNETFAAMCSNVDADLSRLHIGTKIFVVIDKATPNCPLIARYNVKGKDMTIEGSEKAAYIFAMMCFIAGFWSLVH